jgi:fatty acid desaturase
MGSLERTAIDRTADRSDGLPKPSVGENSERREWLPERVEWPTVAVAGVIYGAIALAVGLVATDTVPWWAVMPVLAWCAAWQASLQHDVIHGHPTPWRWINRLIAGPLLLLFLPYDRYWDSHLAHHVDARLIDPLEDPETWYVTADRWRRATGIERRLRLAMNTFGGRMILGPPWLLVQSILVDLDDLRHGRRICACAAYAGQVLLLVWGLELSGIPALGYLLAVAWPGTSLLLVRSFAEHRPHPDPAARSVIVDSHGPFALLFLSNNLHAVHHERPGLPWYILRRVYRDGRSGILARNGGFRFESYGIMARRHFLFPVDHPVHPRDRRG